MRRTMHHYRPSIKCGALALFALLHTLLWAQGYSDLGPYNQFRTAQNALYWKNKMPHLGYWQQDVHYKIQARIDETTDIITAEQELTYFNNSPDTLHYLFFHLYQNAFQPGSYLHDLQEHNDLHPTYGKYENARLGTVLDEVKSNRKDLKTELDNTIIKVYLDEPIAPNASAKIFMRFRTFYDAGSTRRRMKKYGAWGFKHYNGCQWYPKVCVYDRKFGWCTDQHLNREFYGDYGTFDVDLTFANNYIVEATGHLMNENEMLPDTLRKKLDIRNFKDKPWDEKPSVIIPYKKGQTKTWSYHAENVHDFAFTADPSYRVLDTIIYPSVQFPKLALGKQGDVRGVRCVALVQEPHASGWQTAHEYLAKIIHAFSRDFGVYEYPKIVVADAADGMEYPMLTLDGGRDPEYRGLLVHEVGHNWFYGMIGSNETYRAAMDEGFTQFLTAWGMEAIDGKFIVQDSSKNKYIRKFWQATPVRDNKFFYSYLSDAIVHNDEPLNTHSDGFNGALGQGGGYRHVYSKTATMLYNLQYVLGDSLFLAAMQHYMQQWKIAHPYPEDFRNSIIRFTGVDLNWFFDEWMETTKNIDYKVGKVRKGQFKDEYEITLRRKGRMQMPIDLRVVSKKDSVYDFIIPNTWWEKDTDANTLSRWIGWDKLRPTYTATVTIPHGIKNVIIDPSERLADVNMLNNRKRGTVDFRFDSRIFPFPSWTKYRMYMRPDIWWNAYDGFKVGIHLHGNYMNVKHVFAFSAWVNTHLAQGGPAYYIDKSSRKKAGWFSYRFDYSTALDPLIKKGTFYFNSRWLDGYEMYRLGITKQFPHNVTLDVNFKGFTRNKEGWRNYLLYPSEWSTIWTGNKKFNASLNITATYSYSHPKFYGFLSAHLRSAMLSSSYNYHYIELTNILKASAWKFDFRTRVYGRFGTAKDLPSESALFFAGGNPEEMMESKYYRAAGFVPASMAYTYRDNMNHLHFGGGLNMRGYAGYLLAEKDVNGIVLPAYKGASGFAVNVEMDFNRIVKVKNAKLKSIFDLNTYLFADAGAIAYSNTLNKQQLSQIRADAGAGVALTIKRWGPLQNIKPLTLRFDVPFFITHAPFANQKHFDFRWVVAVSRAF
jgi:hypothetical protein